MEQLFVIKIGGNVIDREEDLQDFLRVFASIEAPKVLVHGGGKIATQLGEQLGLKANYTNGRRITDAATIDLVTMVYGGLLNKKIVARLQALQCNAIGLTGADANIIPAVKRPVKDVDYGFVGDVQEDKIDGQMLQNFIHNGLVPVLAPLTHDGLGQMLNTNADTIASSVAVALSAYYKVRLVYCFEKNGVLMDVNDEQSVIHHMDKDLYARLKNEGKLFEGILPKIDNAFAAIDKGVSEVLIGDAKQLQQNCTGAVKGTLFQ